MIEWQTLLNSLKLPSFPLNVHVFHFASDRLSYVYANIFSLCLLCCPFLSLPYSWASKNSSD